MQSPILCRYPSVAKAHMLWQIASPLLTQRGVGVFISFAAEITLVISVIILYKNMLLINIKRNKMIKSYTSSKMSKASFK